ncbi:DHHC palmitoyltransferase-domain-containing protein [Multifurca ochricompacta]|uniref:Palmitoyltransferase n=1 Tax=Multifurca ochricompacta TaxID=376703 RepID=A0AAD4LW64_9AGAM|nr:DHHC palmitoyltransferase-domain-containing protein [Multifurca ochricompacta]
MSSTTPNEHRKARSLATIVDGATRARRERRNSRKNPQPWFVLKLTVAIASVIIAYSTYVYVGRLCIPMIKRESDSLGPRTMGIVFLSVFAVLGMMMIWAYIKVVFTPPGSAIKRQSVSDTVGEELPSLENSTSYQDIPPAQTSQPQLPQPSASALPSQISQGSSTRSIPPSSSSLTSPSYPSSRPSRTRQQSRGSSTLHSYTYSTTQSQGPITQPSAENSVHAEYATFPPPPVEKYPRPNSQQPQEQARGREPPALPSLREEHRFCRRCEIVKPPRTHHCRACGMCVMKYDHHCPWIGQCVGAQNQKFFFVFVVWAALFCLWTFSTLVALNARATTRTDKTVDPEHIVVIVLSGLFSVFTSAMLMTHIVLITTNQTTVEHVAARAMKDRENAVLNEMHSFWACAAKRRTRQAWDAEWGRIGLEGNLWWLGDLRAHWEQVFGPRTWTWLLPIGTSKDIGLEYPRNPRFDADGRWIPRKRWPPELQ